MKLIAVSTIKCMNWFKDIVSLIYDPTQMTISQAQGIVGFLFFYYLPRFFEDIILFETDESQDFSNLLYTQPITESYLKMIIDYPIKDVKRVYIFYRYLIKHYIGSFLKTTCSHFLKLFQQRNTSNLSKKIITDIILNDTSDLRLLHNNLRKKLRKIKKGKTKSLDDYKKKLMKDLEKLNIIKFVLEYNNKLQDTSNIIMPPPPHVDLPPPDYEIDLNPIQNTNEYDRLNSLLNYNQHTNQIQTLEDEKDRLAIDAMILENEINSIQPQTDIPVEHEFYHPVINPNQEDLPLPPSFPTNIIDMDNILSNINNNQIGLPDTSNELDTTYYDLNEFVNVYEIQEVERAFDFTENVSLNVPEMNIDELLGYSIDNVGIQEVPELPEYDEWKKEYLSQFGIQRQYTTLQGIIKVYFWKVWMKDLEEKYQRVVDRFKQINLDVSLITTPEYFFKKYYQRIIGLLLKGNGRYKIMLNFMTKYYKKLQHIERHNFLKTYEPYKSLLKLISTHIGPNILEEHQKIKLIEDNLVYNKEWRYLSIKQVIINLSKFLQDYQKFKKNIFENYISPTELDIDLFEFFITHYFSWKKRPEGTINILYNRHSQYKKISSKSINSLYKNLFKKLPQVIKKMIQDNFWNIHKFYKLFEKRITKLNKKPLEWFSESELKIICKKYLTDWRSFISLIMSTGIPIEYNKYLNKNKLNFNLLQIFMENYGLLDEQLLVKFTKHLDKELQQLKKKENIKQQKRMIEERKFYIDHNFKGFSKKVFQDPRIQNLLKKFKSIWKRYMNIKSGKDNEFLINMFEQFKEIKVIKKIIEETELYSPNVITRFHKEEESIKKLINWIEKLLKSYQLFENKIPTKYLDKKGYSKSPITFFIHGVYNYLENKPIDKTAIFRSNWRTQLLEKYIKTQKKKKKKK